MSPGPFTPRPPGSLPRSPTGRGLWAAPIPPWAPAGYHPDVRGLAIRADSGEEVSRGCSRVGRGAWECRPEGAHHRPCRGDSQQAGPKITLHHGSPMAGKRLKGGREDPEKPKASVLAPRGYSGTPEPRAHPILPPLGRHQPPTQPSKPASVPSAQGRHCLAPSKTARCHLAPNQPENGAGYRLGVGFAPWGPTTGQRACPQLVSEAPQGCRSSSLRGTLDKRLPNT